MWLIATTLLHFLSILPLISTSFNLYMCIIVWSTISSVLYHWYDESNCWTTLLDYVLAGIWSLYDIYLGYKHKLLHKILPTNLVSCFVHLLIPYNTYYTLTHSMWHILNACKSYYVATILSKMES